MRLPLVVLAEASVPADPPERPLPNPSMGQYSEAFGIWAPLDALQLPPAVLCTLEKDVRDGAHLWIVHGDYYDSFGELKESVERSLNAVRDARQKRDERYVLDIVEVDRPDIDILLVNPRHSAALNNFADKVLEPLLVREAKNNNERLTRTLCYALLLEATSAEIGSLLNISRNTIPRRIHQAEEILERKLSIPKDKAALSLAAYIWLRRNDPNILEEAL